MNIDIAALLLGGGAQGKPKGGLLADDGFSLALDDKLAELVQLFPGLDPQALAAMPEAALAGLSADLLPQQLADDAPGRMPSTSSSGIRKRRWPLKPTTSLSTSRVSCPS
ncbi:hypothetical protein ACFFOA_004233 [Enterobacter cloacae]